MQFVCATVFETDLNKKIKYLFLYNNMNNNLFYRSNLFVGLIIITALVSEKNGQQTH